MTNEPPQDKFKSVHVRKKAKKDDEELNWEKPGNIGDKPSDEKAMQNALDPVYRKKNQNAIKPRFSTVYARKTLQTAHSKGSSKPGYF